MTIRKNKAVIVNDLFSDQYDPDQKTSADYQCLILEKNIDEKIIDMGDYVRLSLTLESGENISIAGTTKLIAMQKALKQFGYVK